MAVFGLVFGIAELSALISQKDLLKSPAPVRLTFNEALNALIPLKTQAVYFDHVTKLFFCQAKHLHRMRLLLSAKIYSLQPSCVLGSSSIFANMNGD